MTLTSKPLAVIVIAILFGGIFFTDQMGWWVTESTKVAASYTEGEFAGQANPANIRGSYTFGDVEKNFGISPAVLVQAFAVESDDPAAYQVKNLETQYAESEGEIGTSSVRLFVAFYKNLPYDLTVETYLPESAAAILRQQPLTPEQAAYLETYTVALPAPGESAPAPQNKPTAVPPAAATPEPPTDANAAPAAEATPSHVPTAGDRTLRGKTTFSELLDWGLTPSAIEAILGKPLPAAPGMTIKDFCTANGLDFETIKPALQTAVDQLP